MPRSRPDSAAFGPERREACELRPRSVRPWPPSTLRLAAGVARRPPRARRQEHRCRRCPTRSQALGCAASAARWAPTATDPFHCRPAIVWVPLSSWMRPALGHWKPEPALAAAGCSKETAVSSASASSTQAPACAPPEPPVRLPPGTAEAEAELAAWPASAPASLASSVWQPPSSSSSAFDALPPRSSLRCCFPRCLNRARCCSQTRSTTSAAWTFSAASSLSEWVPGSWFSKVW